MELFLNLCRQNELWMKLEGVVKIMKTLSVQKVAIELDCCDRTIRRMLESGILRGQKVGSRLKVLVSSLEEYQAEQIKRFELENGLFYDRN